VNGVGEPCRFSDQFFIKGELLLIHFLFPTYPFVFMRGELVRVGYQWSVVGEFFQDILSGKGILYLPTYPFITHLSIFIRDRCRWTVSVFGSILYQSGILLTYFPLLTYYETVDNTTNN